LKVGRIDNSITSDEIVPVLDRMSTPYGLNKAMDTIRKNRKVSIFDENENKESRVKFDPKIGMKIRKSEFGLKRYGTVTSGPKRMTPDGETRSSQFWAVTWDDNRSIDHYDFNQLLQYWAGRPIIKQVSSRGRQLCCLELFQHGQGGIISKEFCEKKWKIKSINHDPTKNIFSYNASRNIYSMNITKLQYADIGYVPDFIWATLPMVYEDLLHIIKWSKSMNNNVIVVIEIPNQWRLSRHPAWISNLIQEFSDTFPLYRTTIDYCTFNVHRDDNNNDTKSADILTNDSNLYGSLCHFRCTDLTCPYYGKEHPVTNSKRIHSNSTSSMNMNMNMNMMIPSQLAEEVAECVNTKFYNDRIMYKSNIILTAKEEQEFNLRTSLYQ
jgi:hypothetical protein